MSILIKNIPMFLHFQVAESICNKVVQNVYQPGEQTLTGIQFQDKYDVSTEIVRETVNDLVEKLRITGAYF